MSGICGAIGFDGRAPRSESLAPVLEVLSRRGPESCSVWTGGGTGLGHSLLATTPEAAWEKMPFVDSASGMVITGDIRLDDRSELCATLGLEHAAIGDGELTLKAYQKWGAECLTRLLGDFAFAIWDPRQRRLFAARDPIGMRQFCYAFEPGRYFVFATDPEAVAAHPWVERMINRNRIAHFLDELETADLRATFYEGVSRLEAAHSLTLDGGGLRMSRYWEPQLPPTLRLQSDDDYAAALRHELEKAVASRLRCVGPVGSMLSGGMDSTAVSAIAAQLLKEKGEGPLATFSLVAPDPTDCVETRAIHEALSIDHISPTLIDCDDLGDVREALHQAALSLEDPFDATMTLPRAVYAAARAQGTKVVLDGVGGDLALSLPSHISRLIRRGRWGEAVHEAVGEGRYWSPPWTAWRALGRGVVQGLAPPLWEARESVRAHRLRNRVARLGQISPEFATTTDLAERRRLAFRRDRRLFRVDRGELARNLTAPNIIVARERYDRAAAMFGVEPRDPFLDLRFIQFCLSLPFEQLQKDGFPKPILRRAMAGLVPDEVRWRRGKEHLGHRTTQSLAPIIDGTADHSVLDEFVVPDVLARSSKRLDRVAHANLGANLTALSNWLSARRLDATKGVAGSRQNSERSIADAQGNDVMRMDTSNVEWRVTDQPNEKKPYKAPTLKRYGDIAKLTATGTNGTLENGSPANSKKA